MKYRIEITMDVTSSYVEGAADILRKRLDGSGIIYDVIRVEKIDEGGPK